MPSPKEVFDMRGLAPDADGRPTVTVTLDCGHELTHDAEAPPAALPGSSMHCPACNVQRTVSLVESSPTLSGQSSWDYDETTPRHRILVFDDEDKF
ncbi:MAG: hypothetical protein ACXVXQ_02720 [Mycobacteriaceae bacterium]